jgi:hypothetical protein
MWVAVMAVAGCVLALSACGGSGSSDSSTASTQPPQKTKPSQEAKATPEAKSEEPSAEFAGKGKNGELATAGTESTVAEREAASKVVEDSFKAAETGDWAGQCATFSPVVAESVEKRSALSGRISCDQSLERLAKETPSGAPENLMTEPLAALRVNGSRAFAFFRGVGKRHFVIPLVREGGQWKLAALVPEETP